MGWSIALNCVVLALIIISSSATEVTFDGRALKINGKRRIIMSGSIHYPRSTPQMWPSLVKKSKEGGLNAIETYVFWNAHEPIQGQYDFTGRNDLVKFIKTIQDEGLYAILRIGPYVCAEWNYGGFPVWLHNLPGVKFRTKNDVFQDEMAKFTTLIVEMMKENQLFASQGGPIIIAQVENEYGNVKGSYGKEGDEYISWCSELAQSYNLGIPWIMCQERDAPQPMINTCNGWYCDQFTPNNDNSPKFWTENWSGWFKGWGSKDPLRTAEDLAFAVGRFFQYGGTLQNYYMYHGGTNFGRTAGGPYITTSYDYDAPLDEYGNYNQPKWGHLKTLHELLMSMEKVLTYGSVTHRDYGPLVSASTYTYNGQSSCFFGNAENGDKQIFFQGRFYTVPGWSVTILPDCKTEVYNTAKVNSQTSIMEKKSSKEGNNQNALKWKWKEEEIEHVKLNGKVDGSILTTSKLLDQKIVSNDTSDYLWYFTSFKLKKSDPIWGKSVKLRVKTKGHVLHAFFNKEHIGSQFARKGKYEFTMENRITKLKRGFNQIALLSGTVGLTNYGAYFENNEVGIHGPVELVADEEVIRDFSESEWIYKIGLDGERRQLFNPDHHKAWLSHNLPINQGFIWYKTTFKTPEGSDAVVVDLVGLGKGHAWVNGNSIGRYWPSYLADDNGCSPDCNYHGAYNPGKCASNCGQPTQRWYHIPRSFLKEDENILILFEELGGTPLEVDIQTVKIKKACGKAYEGSTLDLSCHGQIIKDIKFASFGDPQGECENFRKNSCESFKAFSVVKQACVGKKRCSIDVSENNLGSTRCDRPRLAVELVC